MEIPSQSSTDNTRPVPESSSSPVPKKRSREVNHTSRKRPVSSSSSNPCPKKSRATKQVVFCTKLFSNAWITTTSTILQKKSQEESNRITQLLLDGLPSLADRPSPMNHSRSPSRHSPSPLPRHSPSPPPRHSPSPPPRHLPSPPPRHSPSPPRHSPSPPPRQSPGPPPRQSPSPPRFSPPSSPIARPHTIQSFAPLKQAFVDITNRSTPRISTPKVPFVEPKEDGWLHGWLVSQFSEINRKLDVLSETTSQLKFMISKKKHKKVTNCQCYAVCVLTTYCICSILMHQMTLKERVLSGKILTTAYMVYHFYYFTCAWPFHYAPISFL